MKRVILLFTAFSGVLYLSLTSYSSGPASQGIGHVAASGCGGGGCHGSATANTVVGIAVMDGSTPVTGSYNPGKTYRVTVTGTNNTHSLYGYQFSARTSANGTAGTYLNIPGGSKQSNASSALKVIEHSAPISAASGLSVSFDWTAPATGTGNVTLALSVNAVNGNGNTSGDEFNTVTTTLSESSTSVAAVAKLAAAVYPNPATEQITVKLNSSNKNTLVHVYDMMGRMIHAESTNTNSVSINTAAYAKGMYTLQVIQNDQKQVVPFTVQ
jgi:hypothetical protein